MKRFSKRRVMILAAAMCLIGSMAVAAAGKVTGYVTSTNTNQVDYKTAEDVAKAEHKLGVPAKAVAAFENGYTFYRGFFTEVEGRDDSGQTVTVIPEVNLDYRMGGKHFTINILNASHVNEEEGKRAEKMTVGDMTLTYNQDTYKFVVPDYQITEEEQAAVDQGDLFVSYGASKNTVEEVNYLRWEQNGAEYTLMTMGENFLSKEELVEMAKEMIAAK